MVGTETIDILGLLSVLAFAWVFGAVSERLGYPAMMGELFAGIAFGPPLLGVLQPSEVLTVLSELGVFLLMIYVGMEVDLHDLFDLGPQALVIAVGAFVIPFGMGYASGVLIGVPMEGALFLGIAMAATSLATKSRILADLDLLETRIAKVLLGGALVSDVGVLVVFSGVIGFINAGSVDPLDMGVILGKALAFFAVTIVVGDRFLPPLWSKLEALRERYGFVDKTSAFTFALLVSLAFAELASLAGLHMIIGGFMAGAFLRMADVQESLYEHMHDVIYDLAMGFFAPIFFVTVAFELSFAVFAENLALLVLLVAVAFAGKIIGSWLFALPTKLTSREGLVVGFGMNGRGTVEIIIASIGLSSGIIDEQMFSILVFIAIFTTALVPATMTWGVRLLEAADELVGADGEPSSVSKH
ncbi:cation:proton antiporter [Halegenticoccus tardaugens]|uniref:cation:proton antiporter n=1 Tax=Halegenticoccus tardaugens TaxID=2071624 RepID=UPI00100C34A5|nr:cation:proton antiporter [Halegenticoccus tardaugens]